MSRRGQTEIMGLTIIVILVTIGMFFSITLKQDEKTDVASVYTDERLTGDFLITFLNTKALHCNAKMRDLARDVILESVGRGSYSCGGNSSRTYFNTTLDRIVDQTIYLWGRDFEINYSYTDEETEVTSTYYYRREGCENDQERNAPGIQPIQLYPDLPGNGYLILSICN